MIGAAVAGLMLAGCADRETPSEATADRASAHDHHAAMSTSTTSGPRKIAVLDDCLPTDPAWNPTGGCVLAGGAVSFGEFAEELPRGHPAWRNEPSYLKIKANKDVKVENEGGRDHTFTRVAAFGGGIVPFLNLPGEAVAPECEDPAAFGSSLLAPGGELRLRDLPAGTHKYQCCIHPWMRAEVRAN